MAGLLISIGLLLQRTARPHVALIGRVPGTEHYRNVGRFETELTANGVRYVYRGAGALEDVRGTIAVQLGEGFFMSPEGTGL